MRARATAAAQHGSPDLQEAAPRPTGGSSLGGTKGTELKPATRPTHHVPRRRRVAGEGPGAASRVRVRQPPAPRVGLQQRGGGEARSMGAVLGGMEDSHAEGAQEDARGAGGRGRAVAGGGGMERACPRIHLRPEALDEREAAAPPGRRARPGTTRRPASRAVERSTGPARGLDKKERGGQEGTRRWLGPPQTPRQAPSLSRATHRGGWDP